MSNVVDFKTRKQLATGPVPDGTQPPAASKGQVDALDPTTWPAYPGSGTQVEAKQHAPPAGPSLAGCLVLACPCGSCSMELWAHGVIVCSRCQRLCGSAVWSYSNRQGPAEAEHTAMPDHSPLPVNP